MVFELFPEKAYLEVGPTSYQVLTPLNTVDSVDGRTASGLLERFGR